MNHQTIVKQAQELHKPGDYFYVPLDGDKPITVHNRVGNLLRRYIDPPKGTAIIKRMSSSGKLVVTLVKD